MDQATPLHMPISPTNLVQPPSTIRNHQKPPVSKQTTAKKHLFVGPLFLCIEPPTTISHATTSTTGYNGCAGDFGGDIHFDEDEDWTTNVRLPSVCTS